MIIKRSSQPWDHVPSLQELREACDPDKDLTLTSFPEDVDISLYINYTGLRIYSNGRALRKGDTNIKTEMKYIIHDDGDIEYPDYDIPSKTDYILI